MTPRKRRRPALLSADTLKSLGMGAGLLVTLWQGWQSGEKAAGAHARTDAVAALEANNAAQLMALAASRDSMRADLRALRARLARVERRAGPGEARADTTRGGPVQGPEPMPAGWKRPGLLHALRWLTPWRRTDG